ncbi:hypothetical protein [Campylobacter helveticus]|uniref:Uncharacterized protein n=2 Tax=Campylobacter helveticus TaxID=28898 RepID=A0AAX2UGT1_9BACT|nr:hypothetical protein [Campylobacter helveticus]MCR2063107.1 hypothetical protein [Campylobacter helveticus]TNB55918.1 hypothetical protein FDW42_08365 [Campylobacter helveticus]TNB62953.1 hypothetical protein FDW43_05640 [Campylobacter helveticus]TNH32605.1 hypothetical protein FDW48_06665 [Campylobacter helveticus]TXK52540.1 hypothetical protein A9726_06570 [Campylobacter helveticus]
MLRKNLKLKILMGIAVIAAVIDLYLIVYFDSKKDFEMTLASILAIFPLFFFIIEMWNRFERKEEYDK